jgi:putative lipoprotein
MWFVEDPLQRAAVGMGTSLVFGIGKELYDATGHGDPSWRDLTWDLAGCTFGAGISLLVDYALRESSGRHVRQQRLPVIAAW